MCVCLWIQVWNIAKTLGINKPKIQTHFIGICIAVANRMPIQYFMLFFVSILTLFAFLPMLYYFLISKLLYNLAIASLAKGNWLNNKEKRRKKTKKDEKRRKIQNQYFNLIHGVCSLLATWQHHQQFGFSHWIIITLFFGAFFSSLE